MGQVVSGPSPLVQRATVWYGGLVAVPALDQSEGPVSHLRILMVRVADEKQPEQTTELQRIDLPAPDPSQLAPETALDHLETVTLATGQTVLRHLLVDQWQALDQLLVGNHQQLFPPRGCAA